MKYFKKDKANGDVKEVTPEEALKVILAGYTEQLPYNTTFSLFWEER